MIRSLAALTLLTLAACTTQGSRARGFDATRALPAGGLGNRHPADIAVAPVLDQTEGGAPRDLLRQALCEALVDRLYTPLDLDYVDGAWSESAFLGEVPPDALLQITITRWDTTRLYSTGTLVASADVRLFEGGRAEGEALWAVAVQRKLELGDGRSLPPGMLRTAESRAVELFAREALEELPVRDPVAAHS